VPKEYPRTARINSQIQRQLTELIRDELRDPRVAGVTLTSVEVSPDMRHAKIFVSVLSLERSPEDAAKALNGAAGKLRHALKQQLKIKHIPELHFRADHVPEEAAHIDKVIREARGEDRRHATERGESDS
jgi:ribosome-binding factor A